MVFQAEVYAIKEFAVESIDWLYKNRDMSILSVKQRLKRLTITGSILNWSGPVINPS
jgi:hypothetical protein